MKGLGLTKEIAPKVWKAVVRHACCYLQDEIAVTVESTPARADGPNLITLRDVTAIVGTGGPVSLLIAFSFDRSLAEYLFHVATEGMALSEQERDTFARDAVGDAVNIILGQSTADLAEAGNDMVLSPPIIIEGRRSVFRPKTATFASMSLVTNHGVVDLDFVGPKELFDNKLNVL